MDTPPREEEEQAVDQYIQQKGGDGEASAEENSDGDLPHIVTLLAPASATRPVESASPRFDCRTCGVSFFTAEACHGHFRTARHLAKAAAGGAQVPVADTHSNNAAAPLKIGGSLSEKKRVLLDKVEAMQSKWKKRRDDEDRHLDFSVSISRPSSGEINIPLGGSLGSGVRRQSTATPPRKTVAPSRNP